MLGLITSTLTQGRILLVGMVIVTAAAVSGYAYHKITVLKLDNTIANLNTEIERLNADLRTLRANQAIYEATAKENQSMIETLQNKLAVQADQARALTANIQTLQRDKDRYMSIFREHDLTKLARAKPGLIENRVNSGTAQVLRDLEQESHK